MVIYFVDHFINHRNNFHKIQDWKYSEDNCSNNNNPDADCDCLVIETHGVHHKRLMLHKLCISPTHLIIITPTQNSQLLYLIGAARPFTTSESPTTHSFGLPVTF